MSKVEDVRKGVISNPEEGIKRVDIASDAWEAPSSGMSEETKKTIKVAAYVLGGVVLVIGLVFGVFWWRSRAFSEEKITLAVNGPKESLSGKKVEYEISFENQNRADLENSVLRVSFPENFIPEKNGSFKEDGNSVIFEFGRISSGQKGKAILPGRIYAPKGAFVYLQAKLDYVPSNFNSRFVKETQIGIEATSSPIVFEITAPQGVADGGLARYEVAYRNDSDRTFENLRLKAEYPEGFTYIASSLSPLEGNNFWLVGNLEPRGEGKITVDGSLSGKRDEIRKTRFSIGSFEEGEFLAYNDEETSTKVIASPFSIHQQINETDKLNVRAGDLLRFKMIFRNEGNLGLRDVVVTEHLEGESLDFSTLDLDQGGNYDSESHTITWRASEYPALSNLLPGQEETIRFSIQVKDRLPIEDEKDKNFSIKSLARIDSPDVPTPIDMNKIVSSNMTQVKIISPVDFTASGFYHDETIPNSGPIPPKVGQETSYTLYWNIVNVSNDLEEVKVSTFLPSGVVFSGAKVPENETVEYNSRTNELVWKIGKLSSGVGILSPSRKLAFQVKVKPSIEQAGKAVKLLGESIFSAKDSFCQEEILIKHKEKTTYLTEDEKIPIGGDRVGN